MNNIRSRKNLIYRNWRYIFNGIAILYDTGVVFSCGFLTSIALNAHYHGQVLAAQPTFILVAYFWLILIGSSVLLGLYRVSFYIDANYQYIIAVKAYLISCAVIFSTFYIFRLVSIPRSFTLLFLFLLPILFFVARNILMNINLMLRKRGLGIHNVLMIIDEHAQEEDYYQFGWLHDLGYNVHGLIAGSLNSPPQDTDIPVYPLEKLSEVVEKYEIDRIFIPTTHFVIENLTDIINICADHSVKLKILAPRAIHLLQLAHIYDIAGFTLYTPPQPGLTLFNKILKRSVDLLGSVLLLTLLSPVFLLTAVIIYLESGRPVIYKQARSAVKNGKIFNFYKFRSMIQNADELKTYLQHKNESTGALFKMKDDPRITRFGRLIRRTSIDELPQLFNVLKGDMSLVGPRPLPVGDLEAVELGDDFWQAVKDRASVKPGVTGLWQISGRSDIMFDEMVLLDLYYVEYQSLLFDLELLVETIPTIMFSKGAY